MHARCSSTSLHAFALPALGLAWSFYARGRAPWWISTVVGAVSISRRLHLSHFQLVLPHPRLPHAALGRDSFLGSQNDRKIDQSPRLIYRLRSLVDLDLLKRRWHFGRVAQDFSAVLNNHERWHRGRPTLARRAAASAPAASGTRKATAEPTMISPAAVIRGQAHHSALAAPALAPRAAASSSTGSEAGEEMPQDRGRGGEHRV
eukprot:COSAG06_NODE_431_length_15859_cov_19.762500_3_plen_204_part_00